MESITKIFTSFIVVMGIFQPGCICSRVKDNIRLDGSSTVYVISEAIAEEFQKKETGKISIGISGTGGGFKKLCSGRVEIIGASRAMKDSEKKLCEDNKVEATEFEVAFDGIVVAVHHENKWLNSISVSMLKKLFEPEAEGKILKWRDLDPSFPDTKIEIFAPGVSSGTYDYFTSAITGIEHASRGDMTTSEDDNVLVHGVFSNIDSIGFFSFAYYSENQKKLKALAIIDDKKPLAKAIFPTKETIRDGSYSPLSRPVYIYAHQKMLNKSAAKFLRFYIEHSLEIADDVGFIPLSPERQKRSIAKLVSQ